MSRKQPHNQLPDNLPEDFFDSDKRSKKAQEDELAKELEQFEREMEALQAESEEHLREEFEKLQDDKDLDELDQQIDQWKRIIGLEKRAEELKIKHSAENPSKKFKSNTHQENSLSKNPTLLDNLPSKAISRSALNKNNDDKDDFDEDDNNLDDIEDFEDKLSNWRSKGL